MDTVKLNLKYSSVTRGGWKEWALYLLATWAPEDLWGTMLLAGCSGLARERSVVLLSPSVQGGQDALFLAEHEGSLSCRGHLV